MPQISPNPTNDLWTFPQWAVVGTRERRKNVIRHIAIVAEEVEEKVGANIPVLHMGPPLAGIIPYSPEEEDRPQDYPEKMIQSEKSMSKADAAANLTDLSADERRAMRRWYRKTVALFPETEPIPPSPWRRGVESEWAQYFTECHYSVHPAIQENIDLITERIKSKCYSCAGFVIDCYEDSVLDQVLVPTDSESFPLVHHDIILGTFFPPRAQLTLELAEVLGIDPDEKSWPIIMPGYVLKAFIRSDAEIRNTPYKPVQEDINFDSA